VKDLHLREWLLSQTPAEEFGGLVGGVSTTSVGLHHQHRDVPPP